MAKQMTLFLFVQFLVSNHVRIVLGPEDALPFRQHVFWVSVPTPSLAGDSLAHKGKEIPAL